jgi:hypothetical protein
MPQLPLNADYFLDMNIKLAPAWRQVVSREYRVRRANSGHFLHSGSRIPVILVIHSGKRTTRDCYQTCFSHRIVVPTCNGAVVHSCSVKRQEKRILFAWWAEDKKHSLP